MSHIPYGYRIVNAEAVFDDEKAEKVRVLFNEYLRLGSIRAANEIAGVDKAHPFVGAVLKNRTYLGTEFYPRLIDDETFERVQRLRQETAVKLGRDNKQHKAKEKRTCHYEVGKVERRFTDPYEQAQYAYSQIKEIPDAE